MKLRLAATIATVIVMTIGFAMISPLFFAPTKVEAKQRVMLSFSVSKSENAVDWCENISSILTTYNMPAAVFITGKIAEQNPQTVTCFGSNIDIGSQTYNNLDLTAIPDYTQKLWEVQQGKNSVDNAGNYNSTIFRAPNGATDQDIYSLLSRSGIAADFSYRNQYNVYENGQFVKVNATVYDANDHSPEYLLSRPITVEPLLIEFDNTWLTPQIDSFLAKLSSGPFEFVNASELVELALTRGF